jgi:cobalt-zinc-cadmium efflux system membrane fusion protein
MNTPASALVVLGTLAVAATLAACDRRAPAPSNGGGGRPSASEPAAHVDDTNIVEVDDGIVRDLRITTRAVESRPGGERAVLLGELSVDERAYAEVGSPMAARATRVLADAGDSVTRGHVLAELSSPDLGRQRVEYVSAQAQLELAEAALDRKRRLASEKILPLREVQEAEVAAAEARAALRSAQAGLAAFGVEPPARDDDDAASPAFRLLAPVAGTVVERAVVVGQLLEPSSVAFRIADLSNLWLTVHAFERDAVRLRRGAAARLSFPALPGEDFTGVVTMVGREVDSQSRTVPIRIDVRNRSGVLRPGMSATAAVDVGATGAAILTVPVSAVQRVRNQWCVFVPKDATHFEIRRIGRGRDLGGEVEILSGLDAGDQIVVDGAFLLKAQAEKGDGGHDDH